MRQLRFTGNIQNGITLVDPQSRLHTFTVRTSGSNRQIANAAVPYTAVGVVGRDSVAVTNGDMSPLAVGQKPLIVSVDIKTSIDDWEAALQLLDDTYAIARAQFVERGRNQIPPNFTDVYNIENVVTIAE